MKKRYVLASAVSVALAGTRQSMAQVLYEPFDYTVSTSPLDAKVTDPDTTTATGGVFKHYTTQGTYWASRGTATGDIVPVAGNLTAPAIGPMVLPATVGNSVKL